MSGILKGALNTTLAMTNPILFLKLKQEQEMQEKFGVNEIGREFSSGISKMFSGFKNNSSPISSNDFESSENKSKSLNKQTTGYKNKTSNSSTNTTTTTTNTSHTHNKEIVSLV
jgi:hypothetical protein